MNPTDEKLVPDMTIDDLYREDTYTDRKLGTVRELTPVKADGTRDDSRAVLYLGQTQMMTAMGALPLSFEIEAGTLAEAVAAFGEAANVAVENTLKELQEMRREAASSIVVPGADGGMGGMGGMPGGGKIQMP